MDYDSRVYIAVAVAATGQEETRENGESLKWFYYALYLSAGSRRVFFVPLREKERGRATLASFISRARPRRKESPGNRIKWGTAILRGKRQVSLKDPRLRYYTVLKWKKLSACESGSLLQGCKRVGLVIAAASWVMRARNEHWCFIVLKISFPEVERGGFLCQLTTLLCCVTAPFLLQDREI